MLHEFIYDYKVYAVVKAEQYFNSTNHNRDAVEVFKTLNEAQSFFRKVAQDPISHDDILSVAKWVQPAYCRPAKNSTKPDEQELMNLLSLRVFNGAYLLIEIKPPIKFEECCADSLKQIDSLIGNGKIATIVTCIAEVHSLLSSHTRLPAVAGMLSSAYNNSQFDPKKYGNAIKGLNDSTRTAIKKIAELEYFKHGQKNNDQELGKYWKRIYDEFCK
jgi:hypothetical protein